MEEQTDSETGRKRDTKTEVGKIGEERKISRDRETRKETSRKGETKRERQGDKETETEREKGDSELSVSRSDTVQKT